MTKIKDIVKKNIRKVKTKIKKFEKLKDDSSTIIEVKFMKLHEELERTKSKLSNQLKDSFENNLKILKQLEHEHLEFSKLFSGFTKNMNNFERLTDIVKVIEKNNFLKKNLDVELLTHPLISSQLNIKFEYKEFSMTFLEAIRGRLLKI